MAFFSFHLSVPAQPEVVVERIRQIVSPAPSYRDSFSSPWKPSPVWSKPFFGSVENSTFRIRRNIQYRNSFLPMIRGTIISTPTGSRVNVSMYMHPVSLAVLLIWFSALAITGWRLVDANVAQSFFPALMIIFGLVLSLGGFYFEALKAMPLLSQAIFSTEINSVLSPSESPLLGQSPAPYSERTENRAVPVVAAMAAAIAGFGLLYFHFSRLRSNPTFPTAMDLLWNSSEATTALGAPIRAGIGIRGMLEDSRAAGYAILTIPVSGPVGKGTLNLVSNRTSRGWEIEREVLHTAAKPGTVNLTPVTRPDFFRYPTAGHIYLFPLDATAASDLKDLPAYYQTRLGLDVQLLPVQQLGPDVLNADATQVIAEKALVSVARNQPEMAGDMNSVLLAVTSQDMNFQSLNLRYANNFRSGRFSIISTARFHTMPWYAGSNPEVFAVRTRKLVTRDLALLRYPVDLSPDVTSALARDVYTMPELDKAGEWFAGQDGNAGLVSQGPPCVTIFQGSDGQQGLRVGCTNDAQGDAQFERFDTRPDIPLFVMSHADFYFPEEPSFPFLRKYRPQDDRSRSFGIGTTDSFDIFPVGDSQTFAWIELIMADGDRVHYARTSAGSDFANAKLRARADLGDRFSLSTLNWNGDGWNVLTREGWTYTFPSSSPERTWQQGALIGLRSNSGKTFSIRRTSDSDLQELRAPGGESIQFANDAKHRIISAKESTGRTVQYDYDKAGRLVHVRGAQNGDEFYEYDPANRLIVIRDAQHRALLINKYGSLGEILSQTLADGMKLLYENGFDENHKLASLKLTLPNRYWILWQKTRNGFVRSWPHAPDHEVADTQP